MKIFDYYAAIIPEKDRWVSVCQHVLPTCFWTNTLKISAEDLQQFLNEDGCVITPIAWRPSAFRTTMPAFGKRWEYVTGLFQIQEEVSMLPVIFLDPQPGERVLDLCAAPGNKTAEMSVRMQNRGTILANDRNYNRLRALGQISKRLGLMNISTSIYDGRQYPRLENAFDKVLVDAPCSGEGTFRIRPCCLSAARCAGCFLRLSHRLHRAIRSHPAQSGNWVTERESRLLYRPVILILP